MMMPVLVTATVPLAVKVAEPLGKRVTVVLMLPLPLAEQDEPPEAEHVQLTPVTDAGNVSVTVALVASLGPVLETTMV
jgi:hypothetical protein